MQAVSRDKVDKEDEKLYKIIGEWTLDVSSGKFVDKMLWCSAARAKHSGP